MMTGAKKLWLLLLLGGFENKREEKNESHIINQMRSQSNQIMDIGRYLCSYCTRVFSQRVPACPLSSLALATDYHCKIYCSTLPSGVF